MNCNLFFFTDLTGELHFGKIGTNDVIKARIAAGLDIYNPFESYFYASVGEFTIQKILNAFNVGLTLPKVLGDTGFPKGIVVAYSGNPCLLYTSPSPRDKRQSRMPSSA